MIFFHLTILTRTVLLLGLLSSLVSPLHRAEAHEPLSPHTISFQHHLESHAQRVKALALEVHRRFPQVFPLVKAGRLRVFMDLHDAAKWEPDLYRNLLLNFGQRMDPRSEFIIHLNQRDFEVRWRFFERHGLIHEGSLSTEAQQMLRVESIADLTDRGLDPVAALEFGRPMTLASQFLKPLEDQLIAVYLESHYADLIQGLDYRSWLARHSGRGCVELLSTEKEHIATEEIARPILRLPLLEDATPAAVPLSTSY